MQLLGISKAIICIEIIIFCMHFCSRAGCLGYIFVPRAASPRSIFVPRAASPRSIFGPRAEP